MAAWIKATYQSIPFHELEVVCLISQQFPPIIAKVIVVGSFHNGLYPIGYMGIAL